MRNDKNVCITTEIPGGHGKQYMRDSDKSF